MRCTRWPAWRVKGISDELDEGVHVHRRPLMLPSTRRLHRHAVVGPFWRALERLARRTNCPDDRLLFRVDLAWSNLVWYRRLGLDADVVEAQESDGHALLFTRGRRGPAVVVGLHGPAMLRARLCGRMRLRGRMAHFIDRLTAARADALTAPCTLLVDTLKQAGWLSCQREVTVVPNPYVGPLADDGPRRTPPVVLAVGRIEPTKSPEVLVAAADELRERVPGVQVHFVGGHPASRAGRRFAASVQALSRRTGAPRVFWGALPREEVLRRYRSARVVAIPGRLDSFSNVALEAFAGARPVVCSTGVGIAELVAEAGAGTVVPADDPRALAAALIPYLQDENVAQDTGRRGRELVASRLSPTAVAAQREAVYREAVARRRYGTGRAVRNGRACHRVSPPRR